MDPQAWLPFTGLVVGILVLMVILLFMARWWDK